MQSVAQSWQHEMATGSAQGLQRKTHLYMREMRHTMHVNICITNVFKYMYNARVYALRGSGKQIS